MVIAPADGFWEQESPVILLNALHREVVSFERADGLHGCLGGGEVGGVGDFLGDGGGADLHLFFAGLVELISSR